MFDTAITFGNWIGRNGNHLIVAERHAEGTVKVVNTVKSWDRTETRVMTDQEWLEMWDNMRDHGYSRG